MKGMQTNIAYTMGRAIRHSLTDKEMAKMPAPGIYKEGNLDVVRKQNPKWTIKGKGVGEKYGKDGPGPGQYEDKYQKFHTPNFTFGSKTSKSFYQNRADLPGPGQYVSPSTLGRKGGYLGAKFSSEKK